MHMSISSRSEVRGLDGLFFNGKHPAYNFWLPRYIGVDNLYSICLYLTLKKSLAQEVRQKSDISDLRSKG